ncbi:hypothetical protein DSECCO2_500020 [anaerobic digester metagenome]|uniref:Uncharacterized protein n=1 Tax=Methanoculleus marisnigri (strain ATCC 35101 / DSM 1498 / JR1) TaxID=368407 RepID=A3CWX8_METMJ|nr:hypothetical protein Memar_1952 [Methanoculleus marisnigri JR1]
MDLSWEILTIVRRSGLPLQTKRIEPYDTTPADSPPYERNRGESPQALIRDRTIESHFDIPSPAILPLVTHDILLEKKQVTGKHP